ncbi:MAG: hypothetical protein ACLUMN_05910, partial [Oscillospiraceae bacterium]
ENDWTFFRRTGGETLRGFDKLTPCPERARRVFAQRRKPVGEIAETFFGSRFVFRRMRALTRSEFGCYHQTIKREDTE